MKRRAKGEGNFQMRVDGRWGWRRTVQGKLHEIKQQQGESKAEFFERAANLNHQISTGIAPQDNRQTVEHYLATWLLSKKGTLEPTTFKRYSEVLRLYVYPALGRTPLTKLTALQIQRLYSQVLETRAPNTVNKIHIALHKALQDAVRHDLVVRNVADLVDKPGTEPRKEMEVYTPAQVRQLMEAAKGDRLEALYILLPTTGCRLGELLGLRWECVDLVKGEIKITAAMKDMAGKQWLDTPKTARSRRTIPLTEIGVAALHDHHIRQTVERLKFGAGWNPLGLVFPSAVGTPLSQTNLRRRYMQLLERAGLPYIRSHDQRHTNASIQLASGTPLHVVSAMLGHTTPVTTLGIYAHLMPGQREEARDTLDRVFNQKEVI